jgi:DegV family protein with EDD domain
MKKIGIIVDAAVDLPQEIIEKHQITLVPIKMDWPDLDNMPGENTFEKMRELEKRGIKSFGKTSQPSPKDFLDAYKKQLEIFEKILCITITSKLSGTYNSAIQGVKFLPADQQKKIFIVDSLSASPGEGLLVLKTVDLIEQGKEAGDIKKELEELVPRISAFVMFENPKYVEASGRISPLIATLLKQAIKLGIRPLLTFKDGLLISAGARVGAKDIPTALFRTFQKEVKKKKQENENIRIIITHADDLEGANRLKRMIEEEFGNAKVAAINIIDDILGTLTGPNTLILGWCED